MPKRTAQSQASVPASERNAVACAPLPEKLLV